MKIALCLSGQPRELNEGFSYWKKSLFEHYDVDVFVHSWNSEKNSRVMNLYNPKKILFEDYIFSPEHDKQYANNCVNQTSLPRYSLAQFYSIMQSRNLKIETEQETNTKYDWVIRGRFDYALNRRFRFNDMDNSYIYLATRKYIKPDQTYDNGFCDMFALGSSANMDKYMSSYEYMESFSKRPGFKFYGENICSTTLVETGLRKHYGFPSQKDELVKYLDMNDPFVASPEDNGRRWIHSLIRRNWDERELWLNHDRDFWKRERKKRMRIALCLSGQPRSLQEGFHYHSRNLLEEFNVDVFIHSWNSDYNGKVLRLYNPVKHKFDDYMFGKEHDIKYEYEGGRHDAWPPRNALHGFYSIYQANQLKCEYEKEQGFTYDWVVRSRFDYALNVIIKFAELENHFLYVPDRADPNHYQLMCDQFAFSSSSIMNKYSETFLHIDEFHKEGCSMIGEHLTVKNAQKRKLTEILRYYDLDRPFKQYVDAHQAILRDDFAYWKNINFPS